MGCCSETMESKHRLSSWTTGPPKPHCQPSPWPAASSVNLWNDLELMSKWSCQLVRTGPFGLRGLKTSKQPEFMPYTAQVLSSLSPRLSFVPGTLFATTVWLMHVAKFILNQTKKQSGSLCCISRQTRGFYFKRTIFKENKCMSKLGREVFYFFILWKIRWSLVLFVSVVHLCHQLSKTL